MSPQANSKSKEPNRRVIDWLLEEDQPSVRYCALVDILVREQNDPEVRDAHAMIPLEGWGKDILRTQNHGGFWEPS